jgi:hypothetical protein
VSALTVVSALILPSSLVHAVLVIITTTISLLSITCTANDVNPECTVMVLLIPLEQIF